MSFMADQMPGPPLEDQVMRMNSFKAGKVCIYHEIAEEAALLQSSSNSSNTE